MDYSVTFARHFARIIWLLRHEPANTDEQKAALRALVTLAREGFVTIGARAGELTANGTSVPAAFSGVADAVERMAGHGLGTIDVDRNATPTDIIRVARQLADASGDLATPSGATARFSGVAPPPAATVQLPTPERMAELAHLDFGDVVDVPPATAPKRGTPRRATPAVPAPSRGGRGDIGGMFDHFATTRSSTATHTDLLARMDAESDPTRLVELLGELGTRAEDAMRDARREVAIEIFHRVVRRERDVHDFDVKRAFVLTLKRLSKPALLAAVVADLASSPEARERGVAILARTGEDGADAVIEQLVAEEGRKERRVYFDALVHLQAGIPTLIHMLGDARWYVARNAATLLGEMQAREAERSLVGLLHHDDERVRHAATVALMRLGTARSLPTITEALKDGAPQIRMQAAAALAGRAEGNITAMLLRALDDERDDEVCAAFLLALGRLGTAEAVARLVATAEPDKGLFRRKPVALRVAAVQGLAEALTPEALTALQALQADKDEDVRATAVYALGRRARQGDAR